MIVKTEFNEDLDIYEVLEKFVYNKYTFLILLGISEISGKLNTSYTLSDKWNVSKSYAWKILGRLEDEHLIEKGERIEKDGSYYFNYILSKNAKKIFRELAIFFNKFDKDE